jgi:hypothetical protein
MRQRPTFAGAVGPTDQPRLPPAASAASPANARSVFAPVPHLQLVDTMLGSTSDGGRFRTQTGVMRWMKGIVMVADCLV